MIVVSDTSPIRNLAKVGRLDLLRRLYTEVVIPPAVEAELLATARDLREIARLEEQLDPGEAEAIVVAMEIDAQLILVTRNAEGK